jgi:hypothetical protein
MEPTAILSVIASCLKLASSIAEYVERVKHSAMALENAANEVRIFAKVLATIKSTFESGSLVKAIRDGSTRHETQAFEQMEGLLRSSEVSLKVVERLIRAASQKGFLGLSFGRDFVPVQLEEVNMEKNKLAAYREALQMLMQLVALYHFILTC